MQRLIVGPARDDEGLELALAEWRDRAKGGFDATRCAAHVDGDLVVPNPGVAQDVERRNEPVGGSEPQQAFSQAIRVPAQLDAAIVHDVDPTG